MCISTDIIGPSGDDAKATVFQAVTACKKAEETIRWLYEELGRREEKIRELEKMIDLTLHPREG